MENHLALEMLDIRKAFPGVVALDDVSFDLRKGEVHVLLGENGAGKSTLMKILSGAYQKTAGRILIEGREVEIRSPRHARQLGISTIYQELNLIPRLSAGENIFLGREPSKAMGFLDRAALHHAAAGILHGLGVDLDPRIRVSQLGIAQQQMVEIAKAISLDAGILIMDEPTSALTDREIAELFARMRKLRAAGVSIIYISHRLEELAEIGDRVTVLRDGRRVGTHNIQEISKQDLIRLMVNRELTSQLPNVPGERGAEALRVEGLNRGGVLHDITFSLRRGEILGIAGLLGSGRTELARAIFGVDRIDSGRIYVKGELREIDCPRDAINMGIGFLTEDRKTQGLVPLLSARENICLASVDRFSRYGFVSSGEETRAANRYIGDLRIKASSVDQRVLYLSGGTQQKVVLSKWLCCQAEIFIFDEPTRGIDVGAKAEIYQLMNELTSSGVAIIMISSELPEILGMSDRILVMHRGRIAAEFPAGEATQESILHAAVGQ